MTTASRHARRKPSTAPASGDELTPQTPVCVAGATPGCELPLTVPGTPSLEEARSVVAREAMRWTYVLRSRRRWVDEASSREQNEIAACAALLHFGIDDAGEIAP